MKILTRDEKENLKTFMCITNVAFPVLWPVYFAGVAYNRHKIKQERKQLENSTHYSSAAHQHFLFSKKHKHANRSVSINQNTEQYSVIPSNTNR